MRHPDVSFKQDIEIIYADLPLTPIVTIFRRDGLPLSHMGAHRVLRKGQGEGSFAHCINR
jgi:hypothetical protein